MPRCYLGICHNHDNFLDASERRNISKFRSFETGCHLDTIHPEYTITQNSSKPRGGCPLLIRPVVECRDVLGLMPGKLITLVGRKVGSEVLMRVGRRGKECKGTESLRVSLFSPSSRKTPLLHNTGICFKLMKVSWGRSATVGPFELHI